MVEHDPDAPAGLLAGWAASRDLTVTTVALHAGQPLPAPSACDTAVLLGSEQTAYDGTVPWLAAELAFTERLLAAAVPVLGICFGGQVLARVLGARLYRLAEPEIGWVRVTSKYPALAEGPWPSWHRDGFGLPAGAAPGLIRHALGQLNLSLKLTCLLINAVACDVRRDIPGPPGYQPPASRSASR